MCTGAAARISYGSRRIARSTVSIVRIWLVGSLSWVDFTNMLMAGKAATHIFSNIIPCPDVSGVFTTSFCCSDVPGSSAANQSCCEQKFKMPSGFGNPFMPSTNTGQQVQPDSNSTSSSAHAESSSTASSSSVTPSSSTITGTPGTSPSTAAHAQPANHAMQIGVVTGVPLGLLLLSALGILLIRERRGRIKAEKLMQNAKMGGGELDVETHDPFSRTDAERQELEEIHLRELQSSEVHEVS